MLNMVAAFNRVKCYISDGETFLDHLFEELDLRLFGDLGIFASRAIYSSPFLHYNHYNKIMNF